MTTIPFDPTIFLTSIRENTYISNLVAYEVNILVLHSLAGSVNVDVMQVNMAIDGRINSIVSRESKNSDEVIGYWHYT